MKAEPGDPMLELVKQQGYVPAGCNLAGMLVMHLTTKGEDPCAGCNEDRAKCKGRPNKGDTL